jgi:threonyl-tRNA synthetase
MIKITFPDGTVKEHEKGLTALEIIKQDIGEGLARAALAVKLDDEMLDLGAPINKSGKLTVFTFKDPEGVEVFRHSASHIMTQAVLRVFKGQDIGLGVGVAVENGFYQDYDIKPLHPEDLEKIEAEMKKIVDEKIEIKQRDIPKEEALKIYKKDPYKTELAKVIPGDIVSMYSQGEFDNLCKGPHVPNTSYIKSFKLMKIAGAYWRGDAKNKQLQRVYGVAFPDKKDLKKYLNLIEEAGKRDHRKIGKDLDLIYFHEYAPGAPFYLKKGTIMYNILIDFIREEYKKRDYEEVITPQLYNKKLWETSGHWEHYKEDMFIVNIEGEEHSLKPMNCPSHCLIYNRDVKSYKELPIRIADFCNLHRNELSGTLAGMFRVRKFAQDDGHIFCRFDQIENEVLGVLDFIEHVWTKVFNFKLKYYLSTMPKKALGDKELWDKAEDLLKKALKKAKIDYEIKEGEGAFYGPKIDIDIEDALGRKWQCPTCQLDFNLPERFKTSYEGKDGKKHQAVMIHRAILGSLERFIGIMIEHFEGKFPLWLAPVQVRVLTVSEKFNNYAQKVADELKEAGLRVETDFRTESVGKKVRQAQIEKIPLALNIGEKEETAKTVALRTLDGKVKFGLKVSKLISKIQKNVEEKKIEF